MGTGAEQDFVAGPELLHGHIPPAGGSLSLCLRQVGARISDKVTTGSQSHVKTILGVSETFV